MSTQAIYATLTKHGRLGQKPSKETQLKSELLLEKLVRFDLAKAQGTSLISDTDISRILGRSIHVLRYMRTKDTYLKKRIELTTGISTDAQISVKESIERHKQVLELMLPDAFRVLANNLRTVPTNTVEKRLQTTVALEVLDRQGAFPKISRTDSHVKVDHDFSSLDMASKELLASIDGPVQRSAQDKAIDDIIATNKAFTNTEVLNRDEQAETMKQLDSIPQITDKVQ